MKRYIINTVTFIVAMMIVTFLMTLIAAYI